MADILDFKNNKKNPVINEEKTQISSENVELIGFLTYDDRSIGIKNRKDIKAIMLFIQKMKIELNEYL